MKGITFLFRAQVKKIRQGQKTGPSWWNLTVLANPEAKLQEYVRIIQFFLVTFCVLMQ